MEENFNHIVYSKNTLEFVTVANEYVHIIETIEQLDRNDFLSTLQKILPLMYLKFTLVPEAENEYDEFIEKSVTEEAYNYYEQLIKSKLGKYNDYLEVFDPNMSLSEEPLSSKISENLTDIYQDVKDFISAYRIGTLDVMNDALWECQQNFEHYWGQKLLNTLRAVHMILYNPGPIDDDHVISDENISNGNSENWILSKMQEQYRRENDGE